MPWLTNQLADSLYQMGGQKDTIRLPKLHLYQITNQLSARSDSLIQFRLATQEDDELVLLKHAITQGWPSTIKEVPNVLQPYWTFREECTVDDGLVLKGTRIVKGIHEGHLGLNKCKLCAKDTIYWPGLNDQLEKLILNLNFAWNIPNLAAGNNPVCHLVRRYFYMHGQNTPQTSSSWRSILPICCILYKQVSGCMQAIIHDWTAYSNSLQVNLFRIWLARNFNFWQWSTLCSKSFY